jgi:hypothetical protein
VHSSNEERAKRNEEFHREANELLVREELEEARGEADVVCECAARGCMARIRTTPQEYIETHSLPNRFIVVHGHEVPEVEDVIESRPMFLVVEKRPD